MSKLTNEEITELKRIVEGAPDGATHIDDENGYWALSDRQDTSFRSWIENKGWRTMTHSSGFIFRLLSDLNTIIAQHEEIASKDAEIERLREKQDSKAITMLFGLMGYLTSMEEPITFSANHNATSGADILLRLIEANNLKGDCDWDSYKPPKETKDHE